MCDPDFAQPFLLKPANGREVVSYTKVNDLLMALSEALLPLPDLHQLGTIKKAQSPTTVGAKEGKDVPATMTPFKGYGTFVATMIAYSLLYHGDQGCFALPEEAWKVLYDLNRHPSTTTAPDWVIELSQTLADIDFFAAIPLHTLVRSGTTVLASPPSANSGSSQAAGEHP